VVGNILPLCVGRADSDGDGEAVALPIALAEAVKAEEALGDGRAQDERVRDGEADSLALPLADGSAEVPCDGDGVALAEKEAKRPGECEGEVVPLPPPSEALPLRDGKTLAEDDAVATESDGRALADCAAEAEDEAAPLELPVGDRVAVGEPLATPAAMGKTDVLALRDGVIVEVGEGVVVTTVARALDDPDGAAEDEREAAPLLLPVDDHVAMGEPLAMDGEPLALIVTCTLPDDVGEPEPPLAVREDVERALPERLAEPVREPEPLTLGEALPLPKPVRELVCVGERSAEAEALVDTDAEKEKEARAESVVVVVIVAVGEGARSESVK
jgi:hypothetical protein